MPPSAAAARAAPRGGTRAARGGAILPFAAPADDDGDGDGWGSAEADAAAAAVGCHTAVCDGGDAPAPGRRMR